MPSSTRSSPRAYVLTIIEITATQHKYTCDQRDYKLVIQQSCTVIQYHISFIKTHISISISKPKIYKNLFDQTMTN